MDQTPITERIERIRRLLDPIYSDPSQQNLDHAEDQLRELLDVVEMYVQYEIQINEIQRILDDPFKDEEGLSPLLKETALNILAGISPQKQAEKYDVKLDTIKQRCKRAIKSLGLKSQRHLTPYVLRKLGKVLYPAYYSQIEREANDD